MILTQALCLSLAPWFALRAPGGGESPATWSPIRSASSTSLPAALPAPRPQGVVYDAGSRGFISVSAFYLLDGEPELEESPDIEDWAMGVDAGIFAWDEEMGVALEAGVLLSSYEARENGVAVADVDVARYMLGVRVADRASEMYRPFLRAGGLFRTDDGGGEFDDDGFGWYAGLGFDWRVSSFLSLSPSAIYTSSSSFDTREWFAGISVTVDF